MIALPTRRGAGNGATMKLRVLAAALLLPAVAGLSPAQAAKYKIRWLVGHQNLDYFEDAALNFKKTVETESHGDIEVDIVRTGDYAPPGAPGAKTSREISAAVAKGEAEMGHSFTDIMGRVDPKLCAFESPYLFRGYRHLEGIFEGPVGEELLADLKPKHIVGLSFTYSGGANGIASVNRAIRRPEDLKGLKVGVYGDAVDESWLKSLGATPVPIGHSEERILALERSGALDAVVITWRNFERASLDRDFKYMSLMNSTYLVSVTYINEKFYESLPAPYRALLMKASHENGRVERARTIALNELTRRKVVGYGVRPVYLTADETARFVQAVRPSFKGVIDKVVGADILKRLSAVPDGPDPMTPVDVAGR